MLKLQDSDSMEIIGGLLVSCAQSIFPGGLAVYFMQSTIAVTVLNTGASGKFSISPEACAQLGEYILASDIRLLIVLLVKASTWFILLIPMLHAILSENIL
jgi:hypothetical protein